MITEKDLKLCLSFTGKSRAEHYTILACLSQNLMVRPAKSNFQMFQEAYKPTNPELSKQTNILQPNILLLLSYYLLRNHALL